MVTSINLGAILGGGIDFPMQKMCKMDLKSGEHYDYLIENAVTNVINKKGAAIYSLRSSDQEAERKLIGEMQEIIDKLNKEYEGLAEFKLRAKVKTPKFEKNEDTTIPEIARLAGKEDNIEVKVASFHAGAETHVYANEKNKYGKTFKPYLIGAANIQNMHSPDEKMEYKTLIKGAEFIYKIFIKFNEST